MTGGWKCFAFALLSAGMWHASSALAIVIDFNTISLGANQYRYEYVVRNDGSLGPGVSVALFDIEFDPVLYRESSLTIVTPDPLKSQWDELLLASAPGLAAAYDALALAAGVGVAEVVSGFAVEFEWLGSGRPGTQTYLVFDPNTNAIIETGQTGAMPEPASIGLLLLGFVALMRARLVAR